jgi:hypothetical protein
MPSIDDLNQKKRFKKKAYRPWNLLDEPSANIPATALQNEKSEGLHIEQPATLAVDDDAAGDIASKPPANRQHITCYIASKQPANRQRGK